MAEQKTEQQVAREIWLQYFNDYLLQHGKITEREHRKMTALILQEGNKQNKKNKDDSWDMER